MNDESPVVELTPEECWQLLREHEFGRLGFAMLDEQHITPINYAVDRDALGNQSLLFRTAPGGKLFAVELGHEVAFEIDDFSGETAVSVVVRGHARHLGEDEEHRTESLPLRPWIGTPKYDVVEIVPVEVTGRRFRLDRPWLAMRPAD
jgi:uncharacterized protein